MTTFSDHMLRSWRDRFWHFRRKSAGDRAIPAEDPIGRAGPASSSSLGGQNCVPSNNTDSSRVAEESVD